MSFVHLHNHTTYSMLDGAQKLRPMIQRAVADNQPAIATTDHGNLYSLIDFYKECMEQGIKPILGTEAYMARESVSERPKPKKKRSSEEGGETESGTKLYHHLTVLAENNAGYQNLIKLSSRAYLEGFYYKPRVDWDMLSDHSQGLLVTSGCLGGIVLQELLHERHTEALNAAGRLQDIVGKDNFFVELQDHGLPEQKLTNPQLIEISKTLKAPLIVTNDAHYVTQADAHSHDVLLCCNTHSKLTDKDRFRFHGDQHYLKTAQEMASLFPDQPEAVSNTLLIGERCNVEIEFGRNLMPHFDVPEGFSSEEAYLRHLVLEGAQQRWGAINDEIADRLEYELEVICGMGMEGYFLILWDLVRHAHKVGIRTGPARGSAGGCAVAYALRIVDIDPIKWNLLFERFLNPARVSMPDIDLDIPGRFRDHMINYTRQKYGDDRVCQIITFGKINSRTAVRDAARVLDKEFQLGDRIAKALPPLVFGRETPLAACLNREEEFDDGYKRADRFRDIYKQDPEAREVVDAALGIEGLHRQDGIHAAAVVIAPGPLTDYVPVQRKPAKNKKEAPLTTQFEMHAVEELGLLKMDYLGLKTLDIISDAVDLIKKRHDLELDLPNLELDDPATYELLCEGRTVGVFQLESSPMQDLLRRLRPESFEDIAAVLALYRPGPMAADMHNSYAKRKNGEERPTVFHQDVSDILRETYGLMVYQEQLMNVAMRLAGYELADGYQLVKTCAKKIPEAMSDERHKFESGMLKKGYSQELATQVFDMVAEFANYAFNKSHSYGYGMISYWTAYLKANYPVEFMTACLISEGTHERLGLVLSDTRSMGIDVLPPDVNISERNFKPISDTSISFGLSAIRSMGDETSDEIVLERETNGEFKDFFDYLSRAGKKTLNGRVIEALICAGAFSSMGHSRQGLRSIYKDAIKQESKDRKSAGTLSLFDMPTEQQKSGIPTVEYEKTKLLDLEREYLGVWLTGHPLEDVQDRLDAYSAISLNELSETDQSEWPRYKGVPVAGIVVNLKEITTRAGKAMKTFDLQDMTGTIPCVLFPSQTQRWGHLVNHGDIIAVSATVQEDRDRMKLVIENVNQVRKGAGEQNAIHVFMPDTYPVNQLKREIKDMPGDMPVVMHWLGQSAVLDHEGNVEAIKKLFLSGDS